MANKVYITNEQKSVKIPSGIRLLIRRCCNAVLEVEEFPYPAEISVTLVDNERIKELNTQFRDKPTETDVLSFPQFEKGTWEPNESGSVAIGDIVISTEAQQHDMDVSALGDPVGIIPRMKDSIFKADEKLVDIAYKACKKANPDINCFKGKVVSGDQFIASRDKKDFLKAYFKGMCAEMEGGSMAQVAYLNEIPFVIIRAISDKADDSGHMDYPVFAKGAIKHSVAHLEEMYKSI